MKVWDHTFSWFVVLALVFPMLTACQVYGRGSIDVRVDRSRVYEGQYITLSITANGAFDQIELPRLQAFDRLGTSRSTSISIVNGKVNRQQQLQVTLRARRTGKLTIGPVKLIKDGRSIAQSNPIVVNVTPAPPGSRVGPGAAPSNPNPSMPQMPGFNIRIPQIPQQPTVQAGDGKAFFIQVTLPKREVYVGEPFYVEYDLYIRTGLNVASADMVHNPNLQGVIVQALDTKQNNGVVRQVKGVQYSVYPQYRAILTPIRKGEITIDIMKARLYVQHFMSTRQYIVSSSPHKLQVKDVPETGRPHDYYGLVGQLFIKSGLSKHKVRVGESTVLTITISGSGSLNSIKRPGIELGRGLTVETLPSSDMDQLTPGLGGLSGKRAFQYLITPTKPGSYRIPALSITLFNPLSERFETVKSKALNLLAIPSGQGTIAKSGRTSQAILPVMTQYLPEKKTGSKGMPKGLMWVFFALPMAFYLTVEARNALIARRLRDPVAYKRAQAIKKAVSSFHELREIEKDPVLFYGNLDTIIREFLKTRLDIQINGMSDGLDMTLRRAGVGRDTIRSLLEQMEGISFARFAPAAAANTDRVKTADQVADILKKIDREAA